MVLPVIRVDVEADTLDAERNIDRFSDQLDNLPASAARASRATTRVSNSMRTMSRRTAGLQRGVQNAAFQVGDFAVQLGSGADASRAFAQQFPQLVGGFGAFGAVLGAVVAVAIPLVSAMRNLSTEGQDVTRVFGTLQPIAQSIAASMEQVGSVVSQFAVVIVNNIDRIIAIGATAAALFAGRWVAGFVAARIATISLSSALIFLRGALIRTGIGAVVVAIGEAVFQFSRLAQAAGGAGAAFGLLADVAREAFARIRARIELLTVSFVQFANDIQFRFTMALTDMLGRFSDFANGVAQGLNQLFDLGLPEDIGTGAIDGLNDTMNDLNDTFTGLLSRRSELEEFLNTPLDSIQAIRDALSQLQEDGLTLEDIILPGADDEEGGGGRSLDEKLSDQEQRIRDHLGRIQDITRGSLSDQLGSYGDYFGNLVSLTGSSNERLLRIGKAFASAQALIDAWTAHNRVLADPTLPWFARIASAAQVLGAGLGAVNAIRSVNSSGGGGGGAGGGASSASSGAAAPSQAPIEVRLQSLSANEFLNGVSIENLVDRLQDVQGDRGLLFV